ALGGFAIGGYYLLHGNSTLGWGLVLIGMFVPFNTTFNTFGAYLTAKKDFERNFYYYVIVNAPYFVAVALVAFSLQSALALLAANLIAQALGYYIAHRRTVNVYKPHGAIDPEMTRYATHLTFINALTTIMGQLDNILVFHFLGAGELALYSFATAMPSRLGIFKNFANAAFPKYAERSHDEARSSIVRKVIFAAAVTLGLALVYDLFAHILFILFFPRY